MGVFDEMKPRTAKGAARERERALMRSLQLLLKIRDEETFKAALREDFGIEPGHPRYAQILNIWREQM